MTQQIESETYNIRLTPKQNLLFRLFNHSKYKQILYGGAAGGGKTYALCLLATVKSLQYPGIRVGFARQYVKHIKQNSLPTFHKVWQAMGLREGEDYTYNDNKGLITFSNGSSILFVGLKYYPQDPEYDRFGGLELTFGIVEEANQCDSKGKDIYFTRIGRWLNTDYGIRPQLFMTTNPGTNFVYQDFYQPFRDGNLEPYRAYIPAYVTDNPYLGDDYINNLMITNRAIATRLLKGEWDFDGDTTRLFKYDKLQSLYTQTINETGELYITADIAYTSDRCIIMLWRGLQVIKIIDYNEVEKDKDKRKPEVYINQLAKEFKVKPNHIIYDADGVGNAIRAYLPGSVGFKAQTKSTQNYASLKAELHYKCAELIDQISVLNNKYTDKYKQLLIEELFEVRSKGEDMKRLDIISKSEIKKVITRSPDIADALILRMYFEIKKPATRNFAKR